MKIIKWIKWIFSLLILIMSLTCIIWGTIYVLNNKGIREEVSEKVRNVIEKVTVNEGKSNLSEIYNIYLNNEKHKLKVEYQIFNKTEDTQVVSLYIYFDGKNALEREVILLEGNSAITMHDIFAREDVDYNVRIKESNFKIINNEDMQYLLLDIGILQDSVKEYYFVFNDNGDLINELGILVRDSVKNYLIDGEVFNNFYDDEKALAKIEDNMIYALEEETIKKQLNLVEYKYYFKEGKLKKEKVQVYENIKLNNEVVDNKED